LKFVFIVGAIMYNTDEMLKMAIEVIKAEQCVTIEEIVLFMPMDKGTFYDHKLHEHPELKFQLQQMKVAIKNKMRRKWRDSENATLQIAEFKLIGTDEEVDRLNTQRINQNLTVNKPGISLTFGAESDDNG
jgi:hypothetical protein